MAGWVKKRFLKPDVGPGSRFTTEASGNIIGNGLVKFSATGVAAVTSNARQIDGILVTDENVISGDSVIVAQGGEVTGIAAVAINEFEYVKAYANGKIGPFLSVELADNTIGTSVGAGFTNQPANDGVELISDSASDTQLVDIWGTTNGGVTVVKERVTLTGTTAVSTSKTDWGVILGVEIADGEPVAVGTITVREASGNAAITTIAASGRRSGVVLVSRTAKRGFLNSVTAAADAASTKTIGLVGTDADSATELAACVLRGTSRTIVDETVVFETVTKLLVGDLESARTLTVRTALAADSIQLRCGVALETVIAGDTCDFLFEGKTELAPALGTLKSVDRVIQPAQVLALNATPQTLVPAPGAGKALVFEGIQLHYDYGSAAYAAIHADDDLAIRYTDASGAIVSEVDATGFLDQTADQYRWGYPVATESTVLAAVAPVANSPLVLHMLNGEVTTGDGPLRVRTFYREITLSLA